MFSLARYAWFVVVFNVVVILLGAVVRATGSGAGCGPSWPTCQGEILPDLQGATAIEFTHRVLSGVALVLVITLAVLVWRQVGQGKPARVGALLSVISVIGEALIGAVIVLAEWVADDTSVARAISVPMHLVNTFFLLAALTLTAFWLSGGRRLDVGSSPGIRRAVILGGVALLIIAASGAVTALADTLFPGEPLGSDFSAQAHLLTRLRIIHPLLAVTAASIGWWASSHHGLARTKAAQSLPVLVGLMLVSGAVNVLTGVPVWMQLVHLALADSLWIAYVLTSAQALQERERAAVSS